MSEISNIKAISIDLDGTLLRSDGTVDQLTIKLLKDLRASGMILIFNTARPLKMVPEAILNKFSDDFWVFSNGTTCSKKGRIEFQSLMEIKDLKNLIHKLHFDYSSFFFSVETTNNIFTTRKCKNTNVKYFAEEVTLNLICSNDISKLIIITDSTNFPVDEIVEYISPNHRILTTENGKYVQVMPKDVSKLTAVQNILKTFNLSERNLISFGDDLNDLEIISASAIGVAMGNAIPEIKRRADYVTTSNNKNGIRTFLEGFLFQNSIFKN